MRRGSGSDAQAARGRDRSRPRRRTALGACAVLALPATVVAPSAPTVAADRGVVDGRDDRPSAATYRGEVIDLRGGWHGARACLTDGTTTTCFDSEAALDAHLAGSGGVVDGVVDGAVDGVVADPPRAAPERAATEVANDHGGSVDAGADAAIGILASSSSCSGTVRLYQHTKYGGTVLAFNARYTFLNLSAWGFDNVTSSYKIGPCGATFYDGANGSGGAYGGYTGAYGASSSMVGGWDNRLSSIYIS